MKIHHNTLKKAAKFGITLAVVENEIEASKDGKVLASHMLGNVALEQAIVKLNGDAPAAKPVKARKPRKVEQEDDGDGDDDGDDESVEELGDAVEDDEPGEGGEAAEAEEGDEEGKSIVKRKYKEKYRPFKMTCGDDLSALIWKHVAREDEAGDMKVDAALLRGFARMNGVWDPKYAHLNVGMQRMNVGNKLRAKVRRDGYEVKWG